MQIVFDALRILDFAYFTQNVYGRLVFLNTLRGFQLFAGACSKGHCGDQHLIIS